ncbi:hypothetical protein H1R20_g9682, partial [Candolleomyces eurysporus]
MGFAYVPYEPGRNVLFSDSQTRIVGGLVDRPLGEDWTLTKEDASASLRNARNIGVATGAFSNKDMKHRHGQYFTLLTGASMGGGQKRPGNLAQRLRSRSKLVQLILLNKSIKRIAGFQSSAFYFLAPKLYRRYAHDLGQLYESQPELHWNFQGSIYPCIAFNCGPQSITTLHFDQGNLSHGLCAVTPLGNFDWKKGGHLVLWELKLVLEFPPGTVALLPSAAVRHCNTPIQEGEEWMSITQFAAGGLFRWVAYGIKSAKELGSTKASNSKTLKEKADKCAEERWMEGLSLFSTTITPTTYLPPLNLILCLSSVYWNQWPCEEEVSGGQKTAAKWLEAIDSSLPDNVQDHNTQLFLYEIIHGMPDHDDIVNISRQLTEESWFMDPDSLGDIYYWRNCITAVVSQY